LDLKGTVFIFKEKKIFYLNIFIYLFSARRLAKFLMRNEILIYLDISNNQIDYDGSRYLAQALKINTTLTHLNMRLNCLDDKAG
jgi:hypothetical protein